VAFWRIKERNHWKNWNLADINISLIIIIIIIIILLLLLLLLFLLLLIFFSVSVAVISMQQQPQNLTRILQLLERFPPNSCSVLISISPEYKYEVYWSFVWIHTTYIV